MCVYIYIYIYICTYKHTNICIRMLSPPNLDDDPGRVICEGFKLLDIEPNLSARQEQSIEEFMKRTEVPWVGLKAAGGLRGLRA